MSIEHLFRLDGKMALVTGASKNIGQAVSRLLAEAGADLIITSRGSEPLNDLAREIRAGTGRTVHVVTADMTDEASRRALIERTTSLVAGIDILINNASSGNSIVPVSLINQPDGLWEENLQINLLGPYELIRAFAPGMVARGQGVVVNMVTTVAFIPVFGQGAYAIAKAGLSQMTRYFAHELAPHVRVNAVCPGTVSEPGAGIWPVHSELKHLVPLQRPGTATELAPTVLYLVSSASSYTTGQTIFVDGGRVNVGTAGLANSVLAATQPDRSAPE